MNLRDTAYELRTILRSWAPLGASVSHAIQLCNTLERAAIDAAEKALLDEVRRLGT